MIDTVKPELILDSDWQSLGIIQTIERIVQQVTARNPMSLPQIAALSPLLENCRTRNFPESIHKLSQFAKHCAQILDSAQPGQLTSSHEALARRLFAMHQYLDGKSGAEQFGAIHAEQHENIYYGLGLGLKDGTMLRFFSRLLDTQNENPEQIVERCFEDEAPDIIEAVQGGQKSLEQYFQSHLILRYDPIYSQKVYHISDSLQNRFGRLGFEPAARQAQVDILAGNRFLTARKQAKASGIRSLRGFAMLFDLDTLARDTDLDATHPSESRKCLSLADSVISRMSGHIASHWQNRLQSVFRGSGNVDGRDYDEKRFFGQTAEDKSWEDSNLTFDDEPQSPTPKAGYTYVVCPGDRLSQLTDKAYHGQVDYRFVLRQNPHIMQPDSLEPGTRLYFPEYHTQTVPSVTSDPVLAAQYFAEPQIITYAGRELSSISPLTQAQIQSLCETLSVIAPSQLRHTSVIDLPVGIAIVCQRHTLVISDSENEKASQQLYPDSPNPLRTWARALAAQIRGDIIIDDELFLPLACLPAQMHRQAWMATALRRFLQDTSAHPPKFVIHSKSRCVDIIDAHDETILRLEVEDFLAIRQQPNRRLSDYIAPPVIQMTELPQLWLATLLSEPLEIVVPPFTHANQYAQANPNGEFHFYAPMGTPVYPIMKGVIVECGNYPITGCGILIRHPGNLYARYTSLATICVEPGQTVTADTMIARSGSSNYEGQPMLRLELKHCDEIIIDWDMFKGNNINYLEVVCHLWPRQTAFEYFLEE